MCPRGHAPMPKPPRSAAIATIPAAATGPARRSRAGRSPSPPESNGAPRPGRYRWTPSASAPPIDDATLITVAQIKRVRENLDRAGHLVGRPAPVMVIDAGYDTTRISYQVHLQGLDVQILGRVRTNRVYYTDPATGPARAGRPARHGARFELADPATHPGPQETLTGHNPRYGRVHISAWHGLHQKLTRQCPGPIP